MVTASKLVPVLTLLTTGAAMAQSSAPAPKTPSSQKSSMKMMMLDPKMHQQMMGETKKMHDEMQNLKKAIADERAKGADPARQKASDEQIEALEKSIHTLRQQIETGPHYLEQTGPQG
jgi:hypothetical protein